MVFVPAGHDSATDQVILGRQRSWERTAGMEERARRQLPLAKGVRLYGTVLFSLRRELARHLVPERRFSPSRTPVMPAVQEARILGLGGPNCPSGDYVIK